MSPLNAPRRGFTLLELVVALALGGLILLGARTILSELGDHARRLALESARSDRDANGERLLRSLAGQLEIGSADAAGFSGNEQLAKFTSWCDAPAGWQERCQVEIAIDSEGGKKALVARLPQRQTVVLRRGFRNGVLRYLNSSAENGQWFRIWGAGITAPLAIGVVLDRDTIIVRIGDRG